MVTLSSPCQILSISSNNKFSNSHFEKDKLICVVCGSNARGFNFGAITCMSCKVFFRRNAFIELNHLKCRYEGHCEIKERTRKHCTYCRLLTCFQMGMKRELFRIKDDHYFNRMKINKPRYKQQLRLQSNSYKIKLNNTNVSTTKNSISSRTFDQSQWSHQSLLSKNDWLLLRQVSSIFDFLTDRVISKTYEIHHQISFMGIQPLKMRVKASYIYEFGNILNHSALEFIKSIPQFISLPFLNKQILLIRNTRLVIMFYIYYQMNLKPIESLTQTSYWLNSMEWLFLPSTGHLHNIIKYLVGRISFTDPYLIKLILILLAFSTNNVDYNQITINHHLDEYYHTILLNKIQNMYTELIWKYMIHQFGEKRAIRLYSKTIKTMLRIQSIIFTIENSKMPFEQKFYNNVIKSIDESVQFNNNI